MVSMDQEVEMALWFFYFLQNDRFRHLIHGHVLHNPKAHAPVCMITQFLHCFNPYYSVKKSLYTPSKTCTPQAVHQRIVARGTPGSEGRSIIPRPPGRRCYQN